jgi:hypothetical protein
LWCLNGLHLAVAFAVNQRDLESLEAMQKICGQMFKSAAEVIEAGGQFGIEGS